MNVTDLVEQVFFIINNLIAEDLGDPRVRARLHAIRKTLDVLLERAERCHHP